MKITAADIGNFSGVAKMELSRPYKGNKDLGLDRKMAWMCDAFYGYVNEWKKVPTMDEFFSYYLQTNNGEYLDDDRVGFRGRRGWVEADIQAVYDRLYLSYTGAIREVQLMLALCHRGINAWYDSDADRAGIDIMCDIGGLRIGVACYTYTQDGCARKKKKNNYHTYDIPMVDAPCVLGGHSTVKLRNEQILYTTPYMDGIAAQVQSTARMAGAESA